MKTTKRLISILLAALFLLSMFAVCAVAEDKETEFVDYGSECEEEGLHVYGEDGSTLILVKNYSCTEDKDAEHYILYHCTKCGKAMREYVSNEHKFEKVPGKAETCTEDGLTDGEVCSVCGFEKTKQEVIKAHHTDNGTGWCSVCKAELRYHCPYCNEAHDNGFWGAVVKWFHSLLASFGMKK